MVRQHQNSKGECRAILDAGILRAVDLHDHFGVSKKKLLGWLDGYCLRGHRRVELVQPLRHFRDGTLIVTNAKWLEEFFAVNAPIFEADDDQA